MVTNATLNRQLKALESVTRGEWVKFMGDYTTDAFELIRVDDENGDPVRYTTLSSYKISITKIDEAWFVYAEEHEPEDLIASRCQPKEGFKKLADAKKAAEAFGESFEQCWKECEGIE